MKTTIFYINSVGVISQWKGEVIGKTETTISIKFSKNKAFRYNLKDLDIDFVLVTKKPMKDIGVCCTKMDTFTCFDETLKDKIKEATKDNTLLHWENGTWN